MDFETGLISFMCMAIAASIGVSNFLTLHDLPNVALIQFSLVFSTSAFATLIHEMLE